MNRIIFLSLLSVSTLFVSACSSDGEERPEYLDSESLQALEVPPQLTRPNTSEELKIAEPSARVLAALQAGNQAEGQVAPKFKGISLKSDQGLYWLEIDQNAEAVWPVLRDFWAHEGIALDRDEPLLGLMETEWLKEYMASADRDAGFFKRVLKRLSPDVMDRFRMRIERGANTTRIFVSHRGLQIAVSGETSRWVARESDAALEKEILYRLSLFAGLSSVQADDQFAGYVPYQSRIRAVSGSENSYEITGRRERVWQRLTQAVNQLGANIVEQQPQQGVMVISLSEIPQVLLQDTAANEADITDDLEGAYEKTPALTPSKPVATAADETVRLTLNLQEQAGNTLLVVTDENGKPVTDGFAYDAMHMLARLLR